jgi:hypothetical protein
MIYATIVLQESGGIIMRKANEEQFTSILMLVLFGSLLWGCSQISIPARAVPPPETRMESGILEGAVLSVDSYQITHTRWHPRCSICEKSKARYRVYCGVTSTTMMGWTPYYDEDGRYISEDPNITSTSYSCSNGHSWGSSIQYGKTHESEATTDTVSSKIHLGSGAYCISTTSVSVDIVTSSYAIQASSIMTASLELLNVSIPRKRPETSTADILYNMGLDAEWRATNRGGWMCPTEDLTFRKQDVEVQESDEWILLKRKIGK